MSNIRFLRTFIAVARYGSFAAAAEKVALTQAAVSMQMQSLEDDLKRPLFDRVGRRRMIAATYTLSALALLITGAAFVAGVLDAATQTLAWSAVFFFASAAASSAYLTVSEVFPLEMRALAISLCYAIGTDRIRLDVELAAVKQLTGLGRQPSWQTRHLASSRLHQGVVLRVTACV